MKTCSRCKQEKSLTEFYKREKSPDKLSYYCKDCSKFKAKEWVDNNPELNKDNHRKWYYKNQDRKKQWYEESKRKKNTVQC